MEQTELNWMGRSRVTLQLQHSLILLFSLLVVRPHAQVEHALPTKEQMDTHPSALGAQITLGGDLEWDWLNPRWSLCYLFWAVTAASRGLGTMCCDAWEPLSVALLALEARRCG